MNETASTSAPSEAATEPVLATADSSATTSQASDQASDQANSQTSSQDRVFLVIVDDSEELERALYYACRRAKHRDGRVALMYCDPPTENNHFMRFMGIGERLEQEGREKAEKLLSDLSEKAYRWSGKMPVLMIEKDIQEALPRLIEQENIAIIIQPMPIAGTSAGTWASYLLQGGAANLHIPVTMVPPSMTIEEIHRLA